MINSRGARLSAGIVLGVAALLAPLAAASGASAASSPGPNTPTTVPAGISAADLPGTQVFGDTPPDTPVTVSFILKEQNISSLEAQVEAGIPSSQYLSVSQFAATYGQPSANIDALTGYLAGFGIQTDVYADDVDVVATGTAGEFNQALTITEKDATVPSSREPAASDRYASRTCTPTHSSPCFRTGWPASWRRFSGCRITAPT